jgi:hypothetical protein
VKFAIQRVFFPTQRGFGYRPVHREPVPIDPVEFLKLLDSGLPQLEEDPGFYPLLIPIVCRRMGTQLRLIEGLPLASRSQDVEDRVGALSIGHARSSTRHPRWVFTCTGRSGWSTAHSSSEMRNPVVVRLFGVRFRSRSLDSCLLIPPIVAGYSDRHLVKGIQWSPR